MTTATETLDHAPLALPVSLPPERVNMNDTQAADQPVESLPNKGMSLMQVLSTTDQGQVAINLNAGFNEVLRALMHLDQHEGIRKSKGGMTIKIGLEYEDGTIKIKVEESLKVPKAPQRAAVFWLTSDGRVTPENPRQMTMFRDAPVRRTIIVD